MLCQGLCLGTWHDLTHLIPTTSQCGQDIIIYFTDWKLKSHMPGMLWNREASTPWQRPNTTPPQTNKQTKQNKETNENQVLESLRVTGLRTLWGQDLGSLCHHNVPSSPSSGPGTEQIFIKWTNLFGRTFFDDFWGPRAIGPSLLGVLPLYLSYDDACLSISISAW